MIFIIQNLKLDQLQDHRHIFKNHRHIIQKFKQISIKMISIQ
jgi:hypothetical protein